MLNALNQLCNTYYKESIIETCYLGERIMPYLLNILNGKQTEYIKVFIHFSKVISERYFMPSLNLSSY